MFNFGKLAKVVVAFVWATFGFAPLAAEITRRWAERNGYIDHPEKGIGWVLSILGAVTEFPWFYPAVAFMTGVLIGLFVDSILRRFDGSRRWQRVRLGQSMVSMSDMIAGRLHTNLNSWLHNIFDFRADLASLFVKLSRAGFDLSLNALMRRDDDGVLLVNYLKYVGSMLSDGHFKQAEEAAQEVELASRDGTRLIEL
jgi:hypothetical protein